MNPSSVSQRRFPANHSLTERRERRNASVSQRRFPANHSVIIYSGDVAVSVSQRRFPANHSPVRVGNLRASSADHRFCGPRIFPGMRQTVKLGRLRQRRAADRKPGGLRYGVTMTFRAR